MKTKLAIGTLVLNPKQPGWGPGKVVHVQGDLTHVVFRDVPGREAKGIRTDVVALTVAPDQHDAILDNLPPVVNKGEKWILPAERVTVRQAIDAFRARFPLGCDDPEFIGTLKGGERAYKWAAHLHFQEQLGNGQLRDLLTQDVEELTRRAMRCVQKVNLLHPLAEQARLKDALADPDDASVFFKALADLLDASTIDEATYTPYVRAVSDLPAEEDRRVASWPVASILPFLAQPDRHLFIKPSITQAAADRLGFSLNYDPHPNWLTYSCALKMAAIYRDLIRELNPKDMIDVQSFFYVTCGGWDI